jgi:hypothetical protein
MVREYAAFVFFDIFFRYFVDQVGGGRPLAGQRNSPFDPRT